MRDECELTRNLLRRQDTVLSKASERGLSYVDLEMETGVSRNTWPSYKRTDGRAQSVMSLATFLKLAMALNKNGWLDLASYLLEGTGLSLAPTEPCKKDWLGFAERTAEFSAKVLRYQSTDGRIDHREDADLTNEARVIAAQAEGMVQ